MSIADSTTNLEEIVAAACAGDESAFTTLAKRYRRELHVHCYRMLGSFDEAEDLVQETLLKAWAKRETFEGRSSFRAWLYRIATNACLDFLARNERRVLASDTESAAEPDTAAAPLEVPWLQPYPDRLLDQVVSGAAAPDAAVVARETIELAYVVTLQYLPPRQRAALILCDVLDWSAKETAELLELSVAAVNSALQRARATLQKGRGSERRTRADWQPAEQERLLLERYVAATERGDAQALAKLLREDVRFAMPPETGTYEGRDVVVNSWIEGGFGSASFGTFRCVLTQANRMPAVACYVRRPGDAEHRALAIDVLHIEDGLITDITAFDLASSFAAFGLPATM